MNELCEKHLQTLKKQIGDVNATGYRQPPVTDRHQTQTATSHRQHRSQAATYQNLNFRTNRRKEMKDINVLSDTNAAVDVNWLEQYGG